MNDTRSRRDVLRGMAVGGVGLALAGCTGSTASTGSDGGDDSGDGGSGGGDDTAAPTETEAESGSGGGGGSADLTIEVGPGGQFVYTPEEPTVSKGATVKWVWKSNQHNIVVSDQPDGADWSGTEGGESKIFDEGYTYTHTFETAGTYEYYCSPHESVGMAAKVIVE